MIRWSVAILLFTGLAQLAAIKDPSWMCTIFDVREQWKFVCYCSVLTDRWVITSADCFKSYDAPDIHQIIVRYPNGKWKDFRNYFKVQMRFTTEDRKLTVLQTEKPIPNAKNVTLAGAQDLQKSDDVTIATYQAYGQVGKRSRKVRVIETKKAKNPECNPNIFEDGTHFCLAACNAGRGNGVVWKDGNETFLIGVVIYDAKECQRLLRGEDAVVMVEPYKKLIAAKMKLYT